MPIDNYSIGTNARIKVRQCQDSGPYSGPPTPRVCADRCKRQVFWATGRGVRGQWSGGGSCDRGTILGAPGGSGDHSAATICCPSSDDLLMTGIGQQALLPLPRRRTPVDALPASVLHRAHAPGAQSQAVQAHLMQDDGAADLLRTASPSTRPSRRTNRRPSVVRLQLRPQLVRQLRVQHPHQGAAGGGIGAGARSADALRQPRRPQRGRAQAAAHGRSSALERIAHSGETGITRSGEQHCPRWGRRDPAPQPSGGCAAVSAARIGPALPARSLLFFVELRHAPGSHQARHAQGRQWR